MSAHDVPGAPADRSSASATGEATAGSGQELPLSLVVFAYDEAANVPDVLGRIAAWLGRRPEHELLFVDDGSRDGTAEAARRVLGDDPRRRILRHERNRGIGAALKTGVRAATMPWVTFLPCDGQVAPEALDHLSAAAVRERADVVFSVYRDRDDGVHRTLLSAAVRTLIRAVHRVDVRSDGPYLFRRGLFDADLLVPDSFFLNFEFPIRVRRAGRPSATVTIDCLPRRAGVSKSTGLRRIAGVARDLVDLKLRMRAGR